MKLTPLKSVAFGALIGVGTVLLIGASSLLPGMNHYVGQHIGDGSLLSNVPAGTASGFPIFLPTSTSNMNAVGHIEGQTNILQSSLAFTFNDKNLFVGNLTVTNAPTNLWATASTLSYNNAGKVATSLANAAGYLHNDGSGTFGYQLVPLATDVTGTLADSHLAHSFTNDIDQCEWPTNLVNGVNIDPNRSGQLFLTNASFNIAGFQNKLSTFNYEFTMTYSNSAATSITIGGPPNAHYIGSSSTNSLSVGAGKEADYWFQIRPNRTNVVCAAEQ